MVWESGTCGVKRSFFGVSHVFHRLNNAPRHGYRLSDFAMTTERASSGLWDAEIAGSIRI